MKEIAKQNAFSRIGRNQRGNTTVEVSLLLLPFMILMFGIMEFGLYFFHQHTLQHATREGMRLALVGEVLLDENNDPLTREASIIETIREQAALAMDPNDVQIYIYKIGDNYEDPVDWENLVANAGKPADYMRIRVEYDHEFLTPLLGDIFTENGDPVKLSAEATYRNELFEEV